MAESTSVRSEQGALLLPPGFRFHPTDEEVITSYLLQKFFNPSLTSRAVGEVDLNKCEPWDLPGKAKMGEKEWYFFCHKDRKYPTGMRTNRATKEGYWKATGKDKEIFSNKKPSGNLLVGMKKTLVFYMGRAPRGSKTNWVMHEFRLEGNSRDNANLRVNPNDEWVVCKVFHKKGEAKTKGAAVEYSARTTPNASSVDAGEGDDDFLDSMIDPSYFNNSARSIPAKTTINAAPYNADYSIPAAAGRTNSTTGSFVPPKCSSINTSNQQFAMTNSVPLPASSGNSSSWNMLQAAGLAHGTGSYSNNVSLHQDDHQAIMVKALGGVVGLNSGVSMGLPSSAMARVLQQNSLSLPQNKLWSYGHPYSSHLTASTSTTGSAENLGARLVHY